MGGIGSRQPKIAVFVDWCNLGDVRAVLDYGRFRQYLDTLGRVRKAYIYVAGHTIPMPPALKQLSSFGSMLQKHGFIVREKGIEHKERGPVDGDMDVELTIDVVDTLSGHGQTLDKIVLFSGDGHFCSLVTRIKNQRAKRPIKVLIVGRLGHTSSKIRWLADAYIPIEKIVEQISQPEPAVSQVLTGGAA